MEPSAWRAPPFAAPSSPLPRPAPAVLPPAGRLFVAAMRAGRADLRPGPAPIPWEEGELLALCDAAGLRRCAAARLGACVAFLLREAAACGGRPPPPGGCEATGALRLGAPGCACPTPAEMVLSAAVAAPAAGPMLAARRTLARRWLPARRRVQGLVLLDLAAQDLAAWAATRPTAA